MLFAAAAAFGQLGEAPKPVLVDVIGPRGQSLMPVAREVKTTVTRDAAGAAATDFAVERSTFDMMNTVREEQGLEPLKWNEKLAETARLHSMNMAAGSFFSHRGIDGGMVDDRAAVFGVTDWLAIGENIAYLRGFEKPDATAIDKWLNSPSHRKNIMSAQWKESAIGVAMKPDGTYYFTQVFVLRR